MHAVPAMCVDCAANGVMVETVQFLTHVMTEGTRLKNLPELFAASGESRAMKIDREDDKDMQQICDAVVETKKRIFTMPVIVRYSLQTRDIIAFRHYLLFCSCQPTA